MSVMTPKDFEDFCKEPVLIGTVVCMFVMLLVHMLGLYAWFIKMHKTFNPDRLLAKKRIHQFVKRVTNKQQKNRYNK